jgi:hypothetical protein
VDFGETAAEEGFAEEEGAGSLSARPEQSQRLVNDVVRSQEGLRVTGEPADGRRVIRV